MRKNNLIKYFVLILLVVVCGCNNSSDNNSLQEQVIKIGVVSDIEGAIENSKKVADKLKLENLSFIIIAGDCYENEKIRKNPLYPNSTDNVNEMILGIKPFLMLNVSVYVIAGNHEERSVYLKSIFELQKEHSNVFDITNKSVDLEGVNIIGIGGYHDSQFLALNGFLLGVEDYSRVVKELEKFKSQDEPIVLVTHGPPLSDDEIDYVLGVGNVGDLRLNNILNKFDGILNVFGHIHEGGGKSVRYGSNITINVAAVTNYSTDNGSRGGIVEMHDGKISYRII